MNRLIQLNELTELLAKHTSLPPQLCNTFVCYMSGISAASLVKHKALEIPGLGLFFVQGGKVKFTPSPDASYLAGQKDVGPSAAAPATDAAPKPAAPVQPKPETAAVIDTELLSMAAGVVEQLSDPATPEIAPGEDPFRTALLTEIEEEEYEEITKPIFLQNLADDPSTESTDPILPNTQPKQPEAPQTWSPQAPQQPEPPQPWNPLASQQPETPQPWNPQAPQQPETPQPWNPQAPQQTEAPQPWNPLAPQQPDAPQPWTPPTHPLQPETPQPWNPQAPQQTDAPQPWTPPTPPLQPQSSQWGNKPQPGSTSANPKSNEEADRRRHEILGGYSNNRWGSREKNQKKKKYIRIATIAAASIVVLVLLAILIPKITGYLKSDSKNADTTQVTTPPAKTDEKQPVLTDSVAGESETDIDSGLADTPIQVENPGTLEGNDEYRYDIISSSRTLVQMARDYYGHKDYWVYIYLDNQDVISNPNSIKSGTKLRIPPRSKYDVAPNDPVQNLREARKLGNHTLQRFNPTKPKPQSKASRQDKPSEQIP